MDQKYRAWLLSLNPEERQEAFSEYMERLQKPDGRCLWCHEPASQHHPVGPIVVSISEPDDNDKIHTYEFCNWECLGHWAAECAGGALVVDRTNRVTAQLGGQRDAPSRN